jgi:hypothetical protein
MGEPGGCGAGQQCRHGLGLRDGHPVLDCGAIMDHRVEVGSGSIRVEILERDCRFGNPVERPGVPGALLIGPSRASRESHVVVCGRDVAVERVHPGQHGEVSETGVVGGARLGQAQREGVQRFERVSPVVEGHPQLRVDPREVPDQV